MFRCRWTSKCVCKTRKYIHTSSTCLYFGLSYALSLDMNKYNKYKRNIYIYIYVYHLLISCLPSPWRVQGPGSRRSWSMAGRTVRNCAGLWLTDSNCFCKSPVLEAQWAPNHPAPLQAWQVRERDIVLGRNLGFWILDAPRLQTWGAESGPNSLAKDFEPAELFGNTMASLTLTFVC